MILLILTQYNLDFNQIINKKENIFEYLWAKLKYCIYNLLLTK